MSLERPEENSSTQPIGEFGKTELSDRKRRDAQIDDYLLPAVEIEFGSLIPIPPESIQPDGLLKLVSPHLPRHMLRDKRNPQNGLDFECELVLVAPESEGQTTRLAVQRTTTTEISREFVNATINDQLQREIEEKFPEQYQALVTNPQPASPHVPVYSGGWGEWNIVRDLGYQNREFAVLGHIIDQSKNGKIRFEQYKYDTSRLVSDRDEHTTSVEPVEESVLISSHFVCETIEQDSIKAVKVDAHLPWEWQSQHDVTGEMFDTTFYVFESGIAVPDEEVAAILDRLHKDGRRADKVFGWQQTDEAETVRLRMKVFWGDVTREITRRQEWEWGFAGAKYLSPYYTRAFGQELKVDNYGRPDSIESLRVFDAEDEGSKVRSQDEVNARIYMTVDEAAEYDQWEEKTTKKLLNEIIPSTKELTPEQALVYAAEVATRSTEPLQLLESRFSSGTRLAIIGMVQHPLQDRLPLEVIEQSRRLGIDFVAVHVRNPNDATRVYKEDREGLVSIKTGGIIVEMSHEEAQRKHPSQYRALFRENHDWDSAIEAAENQGLDVLYVEAGESWKEANQRVVDIIGDRLEKHPGSRGVYFSPLLSSLYWPGGDRNEHRDLGARPFVDVYSLANAHLSDTSIQMAAYGLRERFPGQVHSMPQFVMPRGFGKEWGHFRQVVIATGIPERFSLDNISDTPFAAHKYLFNAFPEFRLDEMSDQELAEFLVESGGGGGFMGIVEINWGKLIDGVVVYPSDAPLPKTPTQEEFMEAASEYVVDTIKNHLKE